MCAEGMGGGFGVAGVRNAWAGGPGVSSVLHWRIPMLIACLRPSDLIVKCPPLTYGLAGCCLTRNCLIGRALVAICLRVLVCPYLHPATKILGL